MQISFSYLNLQFTIEPTSRPEYFYVRGPHFSQLVEFYDEMLIHLVDHILSELSKPPSEWSKVETTLEDILRRVTSLPEALRPSPRGKVPASF